MQPESWKELEGKTNDAALLVPLHLRRLKKFSQNARRQDTMGFVPVKDSRNLEWTHLDVLVLVFVAFFVIGACWLIAVLSYQQPRAADRAFITAAMTFGQDIIARAMTIVMIEALLLAPFSVLCCFCCASKKHREKVSRVQSVLR